MSALPPRAAESPIWFVVDDEALSLSWSSVKRLITSRNFYRLRKVDPAFPVSPSIRRPASNLDDGKSLCPCRPRPVCHPLTRMLAHESLGRFDQICIERAAQSFVRGDQPTRYRRRRLARRVVDDGNSRRFCRPANSTSSFCSRTERAVTTRSCARLSFAAETIFHGLVICCVF